MTLGEPTIDRIALPHPTAGCVVQGTCCLRGKVERRDKNGNPFLVIDIGHRDGSARLKVWPSEMAAWAGLSEGDGLCVSLVGKEARGNWPSEWSVQSVQQLPPDHPIRADLLPQCPIEPGHLEARWQSLLDELSPSARTLLEVVVLHVGEDVYRLTPAAERMHHACIRGLWWHSIEVAEAALGIARSIGTYTAALSVDVLVVGALLHDIGKIAEYVVNPGIGIKRTARGIARYHTTLGIQAVIEAVTLHCALLQAARTPAWLIDVVLHVIESHHSVRDWGSPSPPASRESWIIHLADSASARMASMSEDLRTAAALPEEGWYQPADPRAKPLQRFDLLSGAALPPTADGADATSDDPSMLVPATLESSATNDGDGRQSLGTGSTTSAASPNPARIEFIIFNGE